MSFTVKGAIKEVFDTKQVSERFSKREFVLEIEDGKYAQTVLFEMTGERATQLDGLAIGEAVVVEFNLRGREWRSPKGEIKFFNSLAAWSVTPDVARNAPSSRAVTAGTYGGTDAEGDIPFTSCDLADEPSPIAKVIR